MRRLAAWRESPKAVLVLVILALFTDMALYELVVPFLPEQLRDWGVSETGIGLLFGSYSIASLAAAPIMGLISDRLGRRGSMLGGMCGLVLAAALYGAADRFALVLAARLVEGVAGAALWAGGLALLAEVFPTEKRGQALGTAMTGLSLGTLVGPLLGGYLFEAGGYRLPFAVAGTWAVAMVLVVALFIPKTVAAAEPNSCSLPLGDRRFLLAAGVAFLGATVLSLLEPTLPLHLRDRLHAGPTTIGLLFAAAVLAYGLSSPLAGMVSDRWGRKWTMALGVGATLLILPLLSVPRSQAGEAFTLLPFGVAIAFLLAPTLPELADAADKHSQAGYGAAYAVFNTAYAAGMVVGPSLGGWLAAKLGFSLALTVFSLGGFLGLPWLLLLGRRRPRFQGEANSPPA